MSEATNNGEKEKQSVLGRQFDEIAERIGKTAEIILDIVTVENKQYKYRISDSQNDINQLKQRLESSGAVVRTGEPIQQVDYYLLSPGANPSYLEEVLCLRAEVQLHDQGYEDDEGFSEYSLIHKTNPHRENSQNHRRIVRHIATTDQAVASMLLYAIDDVQAAQVAVPYEVHKIRTIYEYPIAGTGYSVVLHLDECVRRNAPSDVASSSYVGSYIEFTIPDALLGVVDVGNIKKQFGIESSQPVDMPYIAMDARTLGEGAITGLEAISDSVEHDKWRHCSYLPYYYSGNAGTFCLGVSKRDCGQEKPEDVEDAVRLINEEIMKYGGEDGLPVRAAGNGSGSDTYEYFPRYDGLKKFPSIKDKLENVKLYRRDWTGSKRGTKRILFSTATLKGSGERIILVHDVLPHLTYQNEWLPAHKK